MNRIRVLGLALSVPLLVTACSQGGEGAQTPDAYPDEDITLVVQAAAGGGSDLSSRALAAELETVLGVSVVVENRPGASGSTAMQYMADRDPDGYTIGFSPVEMAMLGHLDFDVDPADYDFLGQIMLAPGVLSVPTDSPFDSLEDFLEAAQVRSLSVANSGAGSIWEAATLGLAEETGAQLTPIPFDGGAPAVGAVVGGQVDAVVAGAGETVAAADQGQLRPLAVFHDETLDDLPDVPTATEQGYELEFGGWGGIYSPTGLPDEVRSTLESAIQQAATSTSFVETITNAGNLAVYRSGDEFTTFVDSEYTRFGEILGQRG